MNGRSVDESTFLHSGDGPFGEPVHVVVPDGTRCVLDEHHSGSSRSRSRLSPSGGDVVPGGCVKARPHCRIARCYRHRRHRARPGTCARVPDEVGAHG